jgi:hypothetical protein
MKRTTLSFVSFLICALASWAWSQDAPPISELERQLEKAKKNVVPDTYQLRYRFRAGDRLVYRVEHVATVDTTIQGNRQTSKSRSVSTKLWQVQQVGTDGTIEFEHSIRDVDMWSQVNGREPIRYQSREDEEPPLEYESISQTIGKPLSVVTIDQTGKVVKRDDKVQQLELGFGGLVVPLPSESVKIGATWAVPSQLRVRTTDGTPKVIKTRQQYELKSVEVGVATITVKTQVLTPVSDARIRSQLIQRLSQGEIKFDVDAGRTLSKEMDWNETVVGFNGPKSNVEYVAEFTEKLMAEGVETAQKQ